MYLPHEQNAIINITVHMLLYVQEVVTLQEKYLIYQHQKWGLQHSLTITILCVQEVVTHFK